jgi:hypothetical protein
MFFNKFTTVCALQVALLMLVLGSTASAQTNNGYNPNFTGTGNGCLAGGTCYYVDFTNGNDANNGTSKATAWKRMKGMPGVTGVAAAHVMTQTDRFILKGGETWAQTGTWSISSGGASTPNATGHPGMYIGYDPTWHNGTVNSVRIIDPGTCSATATLSVALIGGGGSSAAATATMHAPDTSLNQSSPGVYAPTYSILRKVTVTNPGAGYTSNPNVSFTVTSGSCSTLPTALADIYSPIVTASSPTWGTSTATYPGLVEFNVAYLTVDHIEFKGMHPYSNADYTGGNTAMLVGFRPNMVWQNLYVHDFTLSSVSGFNTNCVINGGATCNLDIAGTAALQGDGRQLVNNSIFTNYESGDAGCAANNGYTQLCVQMVGIYDTGKVTNNIVNYFRGGIYTLSCNNACLVAGNKMWAILKDVGRQHEDAFYLLSGGLTYNNILRNVFPGTAAFYQETADGGTPTAKGFQAYLFNNVAWDLGTSTPPIGFTSEFVSGSATGFSPAPDLRAWNNTFVGYRGTGECINAGQWFGASPGLQGNFSFTLFNNDCQSTQGTYWFNSNAGTGVCNTPGCGVWNGNPNPNTVGTRALVDAVNLIRTPAAATAQGVLAVANYAPTALTNSTVLFASGGTSQNLTSLCSTSLNGLSLANLCYDINGNARPATGGWQAGAYHFTPAGTPTLTSVSPTSGTQGASVPVTLTGTNFVSGATINISGAADITVSGLSVASATSITATLTIAPGAATGARNLSVTTSGGTTGAVTFTVNAGATPAPTLASISPTSGAQGAAVPVTLTGTNFVAGATINISGAADITVSNLTVVSGTSITATLTLAPTAALGARNVSVTTSGGTSGTVSFTVNAAAPTLTSVSPASGSPGTAVPVTLTGTNFIAGSTINISGAADVTVSNLTVVSGTSITATLTLAPAAALGARNVSVTTSGGTSGTVTFTINASTPTLSSMSPTTGVRGAAVPVTLTGTNFVSGATINVSGAADITVSNVTVVSGTSITATLTLAPTAALGARTVSVTTSGGTSGTVTFTVNAAAPTLSSVAPASGVQGTAVPVTLTGTNFIAGATINVSGAAGVTVSNLTVVSGTSITATLTVAPTAALGARTVSVTTSGGTSSTATFTVNAAAPTLTSVSPASGTQGTAVLVTLTGTNFVAGATINVSGAADVTVSNLTVVSATSITATLTLAPTAVLGARNISVTTSGGTTGTTTFTVAAVGAPTLSSISPNTGVRGTVVPVVLTGTNFVAGATLTVSGPADVNVSGLTVLSSTSIAATLTISPTATAGARNVSVTTPNGTSGTVIFNINALGDVTPPTVAITAPLAGQTVGGTTVIIAANATDDVAVRAVTFLVNGVAISGEITTPPYSVAWNSTLVSDGNHNLTAIAEDTFGRQTTSATVTVRVANLGTSYSIPPSGGQLFDVAGANNSTASVSHVHIGGDSNTLTGVAIIDYQTTVAPAGLSGEAASPTVLVSEAGVPATIETRSGMAYVDIGGALNTGVAIANETSSDAVINYYFTDANGVNVKQGSLTLFANRQMSTFLDAPPFSAPNPFRGTFTFDSSVPVAVIATRGLTNERKEFVFSTMPISTAMPAGAPLLPMFADAGGWNTEVILTNPSSNTMTGTVEFFGQGSATAAATALTLTVNSETASAFPYSIPPRSMYRFVTQGLSSVSTTSGSVRVNPDIQNPFTSSIPNAFAILSYRSNNITVSETSVFATPTGTAFRVYVESSGPGSVNGQILSGLAIANAAPDSNSIALELTNLSGTAVGGIQTFALPGKGEISKFLSEWFTNLPSDFRGILRITSTAPVGVVDLRARYNSRSDFLVTTIPAVNESAPQTGAVVFPHVVSGGGYNTQIILFGQLSGSAAGTLSFTSANGTPTTGASSIAP